jgi:glutamine synthetase adenylyltransferase
MRQRNMRERLDQLEDRAGVTRETSSDAAFKRALDALLALLPYSPGISHQIQTAPAGFQTITDVPAMTSVAQIQALSSRIEAKQLTDDDRETLAALERQAGPELRQMECNAAAFAKYAGDLFRELEAQY